MNEQIKAEKARIPVDVYPVGVLSGLLRMWRAFDRSPDLRGKRLGIVRYVVRVERRYLVGQVRKRNWRAVRNSFNGYLAEHRGCAHNCGRGWTKRAAKRRADALCRAHIADALEAL